MRLCIQYALTGEAREAGLTPRLSLPEIGKLTFFAPDMEAFPLLALAYRRMDVSPTLTDALYDLSRAGSYAAMRELVLRFPMDENERAWIMQMLEENGQTE